MKEIMLIKTANIMVILLFPCFLLVIINSKPKHSGEEGKGL